ncbi:MAG: methylcobamide--CoM methyltransferase [Deltaproteobacteria bacterium]|nr:methylcobamide--CoM methyltransferase [Deltaproteobacteria bacterium]
MLHARPGEGRSVSGSLSEKERLLLTLSGRKVDRAPVICPGGMMTMASREVMRETGHRWPEAHRDPHRMAALSLAMRAATGLENLGSPFCMTVEAEAWGGEVEDGDEVTPPSVLAYPLESVREWPKLRALDPRRDGRLPAVLECTRLLRAEERETPIVANLVGPTSLATSLLDATTFYRELRAEPDAVRSLLGFLAENEIRYGEALCGAGADLIVIADPSATGEILGPKNFRHLAAPTLGAMVQAMHRRGVPTIVHICGDVRPIYSALADLDADALSIDSIVSVREMQRALPSARIMGNVSTLLLEEGPVERVSEVARRTVEAGVAILAPACGVGAKTPVAHLRAMAGAVRPAA